MCDIESVNKIAKYLKVNPGKIAYNSDKVHGSTHQQKDWDIIWMLTPLSFRSSLDQQKLRISVDLQQCWIQLPVTVMLIVRRRF